ncbi:MAG: cobalamin-dependent protein [Candidatus Bathyarchaeia archaeon]
MTTKEEIFEQLKQAVIDENEELACELTHTALDMKVAPYDILMKGLHPGLTVAGEKYAKNEFFLTDLILVGDVTKSVMDIIQPLLKSEKAAVAGKVVIGTVEGDLHDIGKNIVISMLCGAGFEVTDIGIDQPAKNFVDKAIELKADIIGASAILGATKFRVRDLDDEMRKAGIREKTGLICGGWGFTEDVAKGFGADTSGEDAMDALKKTEALMKKLRGK